MTEPISPPTGYHLLLPADWVQIPLGKGDTQEVVRSILASAFARPPAESRCVDHRVQVAAAPPGWPECRLFRFRTRRSRSLVRGRLLHDWSWESARRPRQRHGRVVRRAHDYLSVELDMTEPRVELEHEFSLDIEYDPSRWLELPPRWDTEEWPDISVWARTCAALSWRSYGLDPGRSGVAFLADTLRRFAQAFAPESLLHGAARGGTAVLSLPAPG